MTQVLLITNHKTFIFALTARVTVEVFPGLLYDVGSVKPFHYLFHKLFESNSIETADLILIKNQVHLLL